MKKGKKKIKKNYLILIKILPDIIKPIKLVILFIIIQYNILLSFEKSFFISSKYSYIKLKINGTGNLRVFSTYNEASDNSHNFDKPNEVYINNINQSEVKYNYILNQTENIIDLIWNDNYKDYISYTCYLFKGCGNIKEIDLSHFDSRNVTCMEYMFSGCNALTSIIFGNFDTS